MSITRRSLLHQAASALPVSTLQPVGASGGVALHVPAPGHELPILPIAETSVPFAPDRVRNATGLAVVSPGGKPVAAQFRTALNWPDGSIRWLSVVFEPEAGAGTYSLRAGQTPDLPDLVREGQPLMIDTGSARLDLSAAGVSLSGSGVADLVVTHHSGEVFRSSLAGETARVVVEERGPIRASVRVEGRCRSEKGSGLFEFIIRWRAWRNRPQLQASVTWINSTLGDSQKIRDIRFVLDHGIEADHLVFGCQRGVYDGPYLKGWPLFILQEDHNQYWAKTRNPDGRLQHLSSGGCNGEQSPGWISLSNKQAGLGLFVPRFWEEYPNEISIDDRSVSVGLWPERAAAHLASKPVLPPNPDGERPYVKTKYWPVLPHPYLAFFDPQSRCLDVKQGLAKTQEILLYRWTGQESAAAFEQAVHAQSLESVRATVDPAYAAATGALGVLTGKDPRYSKLFDECFGWFDRHIDLLKCYGKFDYGDFKYFTSAPDYMAHPGTKWGHMGEMAREGYWHNNEGDPFLGLLLYYFRTGNPQAWDRCRIAARHLLDVDIRHFPHWGMYTHSYGHCYVETAPAGAPDHSWLLGLLLWAGVSGDPVAWDWIIRCGEHLRAYRPDFTMVDARTVSVHLHMMCQFYNYTGRKEFLKAATAPAGALLRVQNKDGSWPAYMLAMDRPRAAGFVDHAIAALADYYAAAGRPPAVQKALDAAIDWQFASGDLEVALVAYGLAVLAWTTGAQRYRDLAKRILDHMDSHQNRDEREPYGRGQVGWSSYGVNNGKQAGNAGRPRQFLGQARPLTPGFILAYAQPAAAVVLDETK
ncbi:MAG TPA: hypothetical protein PKJ41_00610 [Bryobacteraceae bacterium]|nr:hypothetical protein [Bryobacteraceae bacterium]